MQDLTWFSADLFGKVEVTVFPRVGAHTGGVRPIAVVGLGAVVQQVALEPLCAPAVHGMEKQPIVLKKYVYIIYLYVS